MIYTPLTNKAMRIAYNAHHMQTDHGDVPYVFHPFHLAEQMNDEYSVCAALLHDVVEDTDVTLEDLSKAFPAEVVEAVGLLTHDPAVDYFTYVTALRENPIARAVKLADLAHNMEITRLEDPAVHAERIKRLRQKYTIALEILK